jgi:hypothetical protein
MNERERQSAILSHERPDRIPWVPRLLEWYKARIATHTMPRRWEGWSLRDIERDLRVGTPAREGRVATAVHDGVEIVEREEAGRQITEYRTPVGSVRKASRTSAFLKERAMGGRVEEWPLKGPRDYKVWEWIVEHTRWEPCDEEFIAYDAQIGGEGLPMVEIGDVPIHEFMLELAGYNDAFYQLADHPGEVGHLLAVMTEAQWERMWPVVLASPARLLLHGLHLSSQMTPPPVFEKYIIPYYGRVMPRIHAAGKSVAMHADNDTSLILEQIERAGWDMVECFVTAPMAAVTLEKARQAWGERVIIFGGLPSLLFSPTVSDAAFREHVRHVFEVVAPGGAFILGVADNVMPDSLIERVAWVSEIVEETG